VDIGIHALNALAEAAACDAPLAVRFSLPVMNVGKSDSPTEHLPLHYRHIERAAPRIRAICEPFDNRELFDLLMTVCACDDRACGDRSGQDYPKAV
jgi:tRNA nucleotidyltransferase (CCA-adding enzyme)